MKHLRFIGITIDKKPVVSGDDVFTLKDTHGFPFTMSFVECEKRGWVIDWQGLVNSARSHGWPDFQTWDQIQEAFIDSGSWRNERPEIEKRIKLHILSNDIS